MVAKKTCLKPGASSWGSRAAPFNNPGNRDIFTLEGELLTFTWGLLLGISFPFGACSQLLDLVGQGESSPQSQLRETCCPPPGGSPVTHVSRYFFSPVPPRQVFG